MKTLHVKNGRKKITILIGDSNETQNLLEITNYNILHTILYSSDQKKPCDFGNAKITQTACAATRHVSILLRNAENMEEKIFYQ